MKRKVRVVNVEKLKHKIELLERQLSHEGNTNNSLSVELCNANKKLMEMDRVYNQCKERFSKLSLSYESLVRNVSDNKAVLQQLAAEAHKNGLIALYHAIHGIAAKLHDAACKS